MSRVTSWLRWQVTRYICACIYTDMSLDPILSEWQEPLELLKSVNPPESLGRYVTFVVWLKQHPSAFEWFHKLAQEFSMPPLLSLILFFLNAP